MTAPWKELAEPFTTDDVKERQGPKQHDGDCRKQYGRCQLQHRMLSYVDARAVMQRLDDVLTPGGWDFTSTVIEGEVIRGELTIAGCTRVDYGYPNSDQDDEPLKSASSDALKRCAVMFGVGRHLYGDNTQSGGGRVPSSPARQPARPTVVRDNSHESGTNTSNDPTVGLPLNDEFAPIGGSAPAVIPTDHCPIHNEAWRGNPGDLYHGPKGVVPGGYCRHPDNVKKARGA